MKNYKTYFIRPSGKGEFKIFQLISIESFEILDMFFQTEDDAKAYAKKNQIEIVNYQEKEETA